MQTAPSQLRCLTSSSGNTQEMQPRNSHIRRSTSEHKETHCWLQDAQKAQDNSIKKHNLIIYFKVLVLVNFLNFPNLKYMQSNNPIWPFLEYQPWGAGYSDVQVVHLNMGKLYQRGEARKMSRWYRQKDITIKMISPKRYYYRQKDIIIGDSEQGDPSSSEANWKEVTLESREYFLMKDGQGVMDRWTDLLWSIIIMNSSLLMQRFFIMVVRSLFVHLQRNSAKVIQM